LNLRLGRQRRGAFLGSMHAVAMEFYHLYLCNMLPRKMAQVRKGHGGQTHY
jgi:hypothetical protein